MLKLGRVTKVKVLVLVLVFVFSAECTIGMVWGLTALKHYGNKVWSGIGVKIKVAFHCTDLAFYALLFVFNVESVAFSYCVANYR